LGIIVVGDSPGKALHDDVHRWKGTTGGKPERWWRVPTRRLGSILADLVAVTARSEAVGGGRPSERRSWQKKQHDVGGARALRLLDQRSGARRWRRGIALSGAKDGGVAVLTASDSSRSYSGRRPGGVVSLGVEGVIVVSSKEQRGRDKEEAAHSGKTWSEAKHRKWAASWRACRR
jgi:hypothetical protein